MLWVLIRWGASNEYPQHMFSLRKKKTYLPDTHSYLDPWSLYSNYPVHSDRQALANSMDTEQFDQGLNSLPFCHNNLDISSCSQMDLFKT